MLWEPGSYLHDIFYWLWTVISNWAGWATGGVIVLAIWLREKLKRRLSKRQSIVVTAGFLVLAFFTSWRTEYLKTVPGLRLEFNGPMFASYSPTGDGAVLLLVDVKNLGRPSICDDWTLTLTNRSGAVIVSAVPQLIREPITWTFPTGTIDYQAEDALYRKTADNPIPSGGERSGVLLFQFPGLKLADINKAGIKYELTAKDVTGNTILAAHILTGHPVPNVYLFRPGMSEPVPHPTQSKP